MKQEYRKTLSATKKAKLQQNDNERKMSKKKYQQNGIK